MWRWLRWLRICLQCRRSGLYSRVRKIPWRREWLPTWAFLPGKFHGQRSLVSYSPSCQKESDITWQLTVSQAIFSFCRNIQIYGQTDIQWDRHRSINNRLYLVSCICNAFRVWLFLLGGSVNFFLKKNHKHFRLCRPYNLGCNFSLVIMA